MFDTFCFLDSNNYQSDNYCQWEFLLAIGVQQELEIKEKGVTPFEQFKAFQKAQQDWLFGFLSYDLKNDIEELSSQNKDKINLPLLHFFVPSILIKLTKRLELEITTVNINPKTVFDAINATEVPTSTPKVFDNVNAKFTKSEYTDTIKKIQQHIVEGDIYELNFCQEFFINDIDLEVLEFFIQLNQLAKAPFTTFYKKKNQYLCCASPERFLKKRGDKLISQPIKGTIKRGATPEKDEQQKKLLHRSKKDRSENVMIVDLVRNDLSKSCKTGSVNVTELFGIYGFEQVYQMISTIEGKLNSNIHFIDAIKNAFPMGSMTGTPKVKSMQLIERYEKTKRGLYSGAVGYITPDDDFDFNVVIRSALYNASNKYLSFQVGGAIVYDSIPEKEFEECLLKAKAILNVLHPIQYKITETDQELNEILLLQKANSMYSISSEEAQKEGFVTVQHTLELLKEMNAPFQHTIALFEGRVIAYALVMLKSIASKIPILIPMFEQINQLNYKGQQLGKTRYIVMGQICIDKLYRGKGIFYRLYENMKIQLQTDFQYIITEVSSRNQRSLRAHYKVGFENIKIYTSQKEEWNILVLAIR